ncbi:MAG: hypothetical protein ACYDG6_04270 [Thermincolia bacterium]
MDTRWLKLALISFIGLLVSILGLSLVQSFANQGMQMGQVNNPQAIHGIGHNPNQPANGNHGMPSSNPYGNQGYMDRQGQMEQQLHMMRQQLEQMRHQMNQMNQTMMNNMGNMNSGMGNSNSTSGGMGSMPMM